MRTLGNDDLLLINKILKAHSWLEIEDPVSVIDTGAGVGSFKIPTSKDTLLVKILISPNFPRQGLHFVCREVVGYNHVMQDGSLCLRTEPALTAEDRLLLELEKLKRWLDKYYIGGHKDTHFEYYSFTNTLPVTMHFEEDADKPEIDREYGSFTYKDFRELGSPDKASFNFLALDMGNRPCRWSSTLTSAGQNLYAGIWFLLDGPPVLHGRKTISEWKDLIAMFSNAQLHAFKYALNNLEDLSFFNKHIVVAIGYPIPSADKQEVHWDYILTNDNLSNPINWLLSSNASYCRIFGRGKLHKELTDDDILIIGTGAIGSSLYMSLLRGGCRKVTISDGDTIEPGNLCRADFSFFESGSKKTDILLKKGIQTSPFAEIIAIQKLEALCKDDSDYTNLKTYLSRFRFIFDCSTDKFLSVMLDEMTLPGTIVNLSISNGAKELVVITGTGNIHLIKSDLFNRLSSGEQEPFFVATGCWSPTFEASWPDINVLLQYTITEINNRLENNMTVESFFIQSLKGETGSLQYNLSYHV